MPNHIINLRGTNGSGKTTIARAIMSKLDYEGQYTTANGVKYELYKSANEDYTSFIGSYSAVCGGVDKVKDITGIMPAIKELAPHTHIVMEGLLLSGLQALTAKVNDIAMETDSLLHCIHLTTPVDECIRNCVSRRAAAGNKKPFNPENLRSKFRAVELSHGKLTLWGLNSMQMSAQEAFDYSCGLLGLEKGNLCTK